MVLLVVVVMVLLVTTITTTNSIIGTLYLYCWDLKLPSGSLVTHLLRTNPFTFLSHSILGFHVLLDQILLLIESCWKVQTKGWNFNAISQRSECMAEED